MTQQHPLQAVSLRVLGPTAAEIRLPGGLMMIFSYAPETQGVTIGQAWTTGGEAGDMIDLFERWAADARRRGLAPRYIAQQRNRIEHLSRFLAGRQITTRLTREWLDELAENGITRPQGGARPAGAKTLNNHLWGIRAVFAHAVAEGLLDMNPTDGIANARVRRKKQRTLTPGEAWAIFEAAEADERSAKPKCKAVRSPFYRVLMATGMRAGAAASLRVDSFRIDADPPRILVAPEADKQREEREAVISEGDAEYFRRTFAGRHPAEMAVERPRWHVIQADVRSAGLAVEDSLGRRFGLHSFRRMVGSELDRAGYSREVIRMRLGHRDIRSADPYIVRQVEEQQEVAERLARRMKKSSDKAPKSVDTGSDMTDDGDVKAASPTSNADEIGERPAPGGLDNRRVQAPRSLSQEPAGRNASGRPDPPDEYRFEPCIAHSVNQPLDAGEITRLIQRQLEVLSLFAPGRNAEGRDGTRKD
jgi:integrase